VKGKETSTTARRKCSCQCSEECWRRCSQVVCNLLY